MRMNNSKGSSRICVALVTTTRAEFGLFYWLIKALAEQPDIDFKLIVTGTHLSPEHGMTVNEIIESGIKVDEKVEILLSADTASAKSKATGLACLQFADVFERIEPDLLLLLGDRFELLGICSAAVIQGIPIGHFSGGELTQGVIDELVRHAVTKLAHFHFVSNIQHQQRVLQLGEQPEHVFNVGVLGLEHFHKTQRLPLHELSEQLSFEFKSPFFLFTFHPVINDNGLSLTEQVDVILQALNTFPEYQVLMTYPNADQGGNEIRKLLTDYEATQANRVKLVTSLGFKRYLSAIQHCELVIGNSSSGLIETPSFHKPTVNIGCRQQGRLQGETVINSSISVAEITKSIKQALSESHKLKCQKAHNPYGDGHTVDKVLEIIRTIELTPYMNKLFQNISI